MESNRIEPSIQHEYPTSDGHRQREIYKVTVIGGAVNVILLLFKFMAGILGNSAAMIADAIVRVVPGVIGDEQSALSDCFQDDILAAPIYTRPADYKGWKVPEILLSGNEAKIREWEFNQAMERTRRLRPDLLKDWTDKEKS